MSPAPASPIEKVRSVLEPNARVPLEEKIRVFQTFSTALGDNVKIEQTQQVLAVVPLAKLYGAIESAEDEEFVTIICEVIEKVLSPLPFETIVSEESKSYLIEGLNHFSPQVRYLSLKQVEKCVASETSTALMANLELFLLVVVTIAFEDTRTAMKAVDIIRKLTTQTNNGSLCFFKQEHVEILKQLMAISGTVRFRIYELIVRVAVSSNQAFQQCENLGLLDAIVNGVQSDDLLLRINAIELLENVATAPPSQAFLEHRTLLDELLQMLDHDDESLVKCKIIMFLGVLGSNKEIDFRTIESQHHVLDRLQQYLVDSNKELKTAAVKSIGLIGSHGDGLVLMQHHDTLLKTFVEIFYSETGDIKTDLILSAASILSTRDDNEQSTDGPSATRDFYRLMNGQSNLIKFVMGVAKYPMNDIRMAAFTLMQATVAHPWGQEEMAQCNDFLNYLLNRATEHTQEGWIRKYAIVHQLATVPNAQHVLGHRFRQFSLYVRQGPFYQPTEAVAATESG